MAKLLLLQSFSMQSGRPNANLKRKAPSNMFEAFKKQRTDKQSAKTIATAEPTPPVGQAVPAPFFGIDTAQTVQIAPNLLLCEETIRGYLVGSQPESAIQTWNSNPLYQRWAQGEYIENVGQISGLGLLRIFTEALYHMEAYGSAGEKRLLESLVNKLWTQRLQDELNQLSHELKVGFLKKVFHASKIALKKQAVKASQFYHTYLNALQDINVKKEVLNDMGFSLDGKAYKTKNLRGDERIETLRQNILAQEKSAVAAIAPPLASTTEKYIPNLTDQMVVEPSLFTLEDDKFEEWFQDTFFTISEYPELWLQPFPEIEFPTLIDDQNEKETESEVTIRQASSASTLLPTQSMFAKGNESLSYQSPLSPKPSRR